MQAKQQPLKSRFDFDSIPVIDISSFILDADPLLRQATATLIRKACISAGFFYVSNHGVSPDLELKLLSQSKQFFELSLQEKMEIYMKKSGSTLGYNNQGYTNVHKDLKERILFAKVCPENPPSQLKGTPYYGGNLYPQKPAQLKNTVQEWMSELNKVASAVIRGISLSLGFPEEYLSQEICRQMFYFLALIHYPENSSQQQWGIGEHTDYGLVTILLVTDKGLEVKNRRNQWVAADPIPGTFIVNIGDMLERITKGLYRSNLHRVRNTTGRSRYAFPLFYDPNWNVHIKEIEVSISEEERVCIEDSRTQERWDKQDLRQLKGTYLEHLMRKLSKSSPAAHQKAGD